MYKKLLLLFLFFSFIREVTATESLHLLLSQDEIVSHSLRVQKHDMHLKDFSDPLGLLYQESLYGEFRLSFPLYQVEKEGKHSGYIFGSCHMFPFSLLTNSQKEILLAQDVLVVEVLKEKPLKRELIEWGCIAEQHFSTCPLIEFFEGYDIDIDIVRQVVWTHPLLLSGYIHEKELTPLGSLVLFTTAFQKIGIDETLQTQYDHQIPLENDAIREKIYGSPIPYTPEECTPDLFFSIINGCFNCTNLSPQGFAEMFDMWIGKNDEGDIAKRNILWMDTLPDLLEFNSLVCVGAMHLPGPKGILNLLAQQGFSFKYVE